MSVQKTLTPAEKKSRRFSSAFAPGTSARSCLIEYARSAGVGSIINKVGDQRDIFTRGMLEGRRSAAVELLSLAGIDPLAHPQPLKTEIKNG